MLEQKLIRIFLFQWERTERVPRSTPLSTTITDDENGLKIETIALDSVDLDNSHRRVPYRYTLELPAAQWTALKNYTCCEMNTSETSASSYLISCAKTAYSRYRTSESKHGLILAGVGLGTLLADICLSNIYKAAHMPSISKLISKDLADALYGRDIYLPAIGHWGFFFLFLLFMVLLYSRGVMDNRRIKRFITAASPTQADAVLREILPQLCKSRFSQVNKPLFLGLLLVSITCITLSLLL